MPWCFRISVVLIFLKFCFFSSFSRFLKHQCDVQLRQRAQQIQEELVRDSFKLYRCCVVKKLVVCGLCLPLIPTDQEAPSACAQGWSTKLTGKQQMEHLAEHTLDSVSSSA